MTGRFLAIGECMVEMAPRDDGGFRRFDHYPSYASVIVDVVARLRRTATAIDDRRGLELAGLVEILQASTQDTAGRPAEPDEDRRRDACGGQNGGIVCRIDDVRRP